MESIQATSDPVDIGEEMPPGGIPARNHKGERLLLFVGIIDILQSYRLIKKLEHTFKAMIHDGDTVSVHRPGFYAERFMNFMSSKIFKKIPSLDLPEVKGSHRKFRTVVSSLKALKHSPSKKNKSVKTKISSSGPSSGQDKGGQPPSQEDAICGLAKGSPMITPRAERLPSSNSEEDCQEEQQPTSTCILPAVLRDRPHTGRGGRGAPPPVPPRSPRRPHDSRDTSLSRGLSGVSTVPPDVVPDGGHGVWSSSSEVASISDIRLEPRHYTPDHMSTNSLGTPSRLSASHSGRTPTPTWTEGTPSYTESTYSGDAAFPLLLPEHGGARGDVLLLPDECHGPLCTKVPLVEKVPHHDAAGPVRDLLCARLPPPLHRVRLPKDLQLRHPLPRRHVLPPLRQLLQTNLHQEVKVGKCQED